MRSGAGRSIVGTAHGGHHGAVTPEELDTVAAEENRSETFGLLERLADPLTPEEERGQLVRALAQLADPRSVRPLVELAENVTLDVTVRGSPVSTMLPRPGWSKPSEQTGAVAQVRSRSRDLRRIAGG